MDFFAEKKSKRWIFTPQPPPLKKKVCREVSCSSERFFLKTVKHFVVFRPCAFTKLVYFCLFFFFTEMVKLQTSHNNNCCNRLVTATSDQPAVLPLTYIETNSSDQHLLLMNRSWIVCIKNVNATRVSCKPVLLLNDFPLGRRTGILRQET